MIIEQHYDEEVLAEFLGEPDGTATRDKHLATCSLCQRTLASLRTTAQTLTQPAVWERTPVSTTPRPDTLAFLRNMQKSMADEDAMAAVWIKQLLAGPRETWAPRLTEHPEWRTGGMVRRLLKAGDEVISSVPADALTMTSIALQVAERLPETTYAASVVAQLQGSAAYDHAYALWYTGSVIDALKTFDRADECFARSSTGDFDRARVDLMRAMIYQMLEDRERALAGAAAAAAVFQRYNDIDRYVAARTATAVTLQSARRLREALAIHTELAAAAGLTEQWRASAIHNMALCYRDLGQLEEASECLLRAIAGYEKLGMLTFRSKSRWVLAQTFAQAGRHESALSLFSELREEFKDLGMANDVAMVSLDMAESLLALDRSDEISNVCRAAVDYFATAGLAQTEPALRGLAYLREAATTGSLTPRAIHDVRVFLLAPIDRRNSLFLETIQ